MRFALLATSTLVALALASYACSSSDDSKPAAADAGKTSSSSSGKAGDDDDISSSSGESSSGESSSGESSSGESSSGQSSSGQSSSSGDGGGSSSGTPIDGGDTAGTKCVTGDQLETSANNDTIGNAQVLTPTTGTATTSFCGRLTAGDTDYWTLTFTTTGNFTFSGGASYSGTAPELKIVVDGTEYPFNGASGHVESGKPVVFKLTSATAVDYHVSFAVTQN